MFTSRACNHNTQITDLPYLCVRVCMSVALWYFTDAHLLVYSFFSGTVIERELMVEEVSGSGM